MLTYLAVFMGTSFYVFLWRYFRSFAGYTVPATASLVGAAFFALSGALSAGFDFALIDNTKQLNDGALIAMNFLQQDSVHGLLRIPCDADLDTHNVRAASAVAGRRARTGIGLGPSPTG